MKQLTANKEADSGRGTLLNISSQAIEQEVRLPCYLRKTYRHSANNVLMMERMVSIMNPEKQTVANRTLLDIRTK